MNYEKENLSKYDSVRLSLKELGFEEIRMVHIGKLFDVDGTEFRYKGKYRLFLWTGGINVYYFADTSGIPVTFHYVDDRSGEIKLGAEPSVTTHKVLTPLDIKLCKLFSREYVIRFGNFDFDGYITE